MTEIAKGAIVGATIKNLNQQQEKPDKLNNAYDELNKLLLQKRRGKIIFHLDGSGKVTLYEVHTSH